MDTVWSSERPRGGGRSVRVELWVPCGKRDEFETVIDRLEDAETRGVIDGFSVEGWNRYVDLSGQLSPRERKVRDRVTSFARWAVLHGERLPGLGDPVVKGVGRMGPERLTRRTPRAVIAEYQDGVLSNVTACDECVGALRDRVCELDDEFDRTHPVEPVTVDS
ncbi:HTH domain-containing protein [Haloferax sp. S1W]|uniref:HTH domain-containing protein n=1 Tax=Haloferax sp. S1W TaxID=3377110 RepID=UPI0037CBC9A4